MDLSIPNSTTNSPLTPVFGDNVQDLLGTGALNVNPTGIIVVNSNANTVNDPSSGVITLRDAINQANTDAGLDLIVFERSLFSNQQTISFRGGLDITHNLDIIAPRDPLTGGDLVTVSGGGQVFDIEKEATVRLDGLIIADGYVINNSGGGIHNSGTLALYNSIVRDNSCVGQLPYGAVGPLYTHYYPPLTYGGGIYNTGTLEVSNSTISGNSVTAAGGGIYNTGNLTVSTSTLNNNSAIGGKNTNPSGGGIYGDGNITDCTISGNTAGYGGGISGNCNIKNCTISGNTAVGGGGIYGNVVLSNSTLVNNSAFYGGGISGSGVISNSTLEGNSAKENGGGISGNCNITDCTISGNSAGTGGGIYGDGNITNSTISGNSASISGGGIYGGGNITNSTISSNSASISGGGIYNPYNSTLTLLFSTVTQNIAANGGGVYKDDIQPNFFNIYISRGSNNVRNTIIAANLNSASGVNPDIEGTFISYGYNLIGDSTGSTGFSEGLADIVGTSDNPIDPRLAPLDFYGGSTQTFALLPDSPAIDADPTVLLSDPTTDQRGFPRVVNGRADIGAFEFSS